MIWQNAKESAGKARQKKPVRRHLSFWNSISPASAESALVYSVNTVHMQRKTANKKVTVNCGRMEIIDLCQNNVRITAFCKNTVKLKILGL